MQSDARPPARLRAETTGPIRWLIADNAPRLNAYTADMWAALPRLIREAEADATVRVIVLRGVGEKAFSAGADISEFEGSRTADKARTYDALNNGAFDALSRAAKPTVAMIHGFCLGGGFELALCCDIRLGDDASQYAVPAAKLGIGYNPRWIRPMLAVMTPARAKELLFTGRRLTSEEALAAGIISRRLPPGELHAATVAMAEEIAGNAPLSVLAAKRCIDALADNPGSADLAPLDRLVEACFASEDYVEGRRAFMEKRKPVFRGQ